jgi:hypothetical protein
MSEMLIAYLVMLSVLLVPFYLGCVPIDCHGLDCEYVLSLASSFFLFFRTRRRAVYIYIKKKRWGEKNPNTTHHHYIS